MGTVFESRVVAETVSELMGFYRPGSAPNVTLSQRLDSNSVFVHEHSHRELSDGSTLGQYMVALAVGSAKVASEKLRELIETELRDCCEQCWFVHEGYATWRQYLF